MVGLRLGFSNYNWIGLLVKQIMFLQNADIIIYHQEALLFCSQWYEFLIAATATASLVRVDSHF
jgi:hypothetical protein